jgi:predicted Zn-dependent peptidase
MLKHKNRMTLNRTLAPKFKQVSTIEFIDVINHNLDNGIELNYINGGTQDIIKIDFIFNAGIWQQQKQLVASTTNALIKEGTKSYTAYEIAEGIDNYGAFLEVENSFDTATVTLYTLTKYLNEVLPYVKEVICCPALSEKEFEIYKNNSLERFKVNLEKVSFVARKEFAELIFGNKNPYGSNVNIGDYQNLSLFDIKAFHQRTYQLSNCRILISGKVDTNTVTNINSFFGDETLIDYSEKELVIDATPNTNENLYIKKEGALQSAIRIGRLMPNKLHPDYLGLQVFNTILGGYFGSRLMNNIREDKGYTYGINSGIVSLKNGGYFFISTEVGADVTKDALKEIYKEIELLRTKEVSTEELDLVKNYMLGQLLQSCDGAFNMANLFESAKLYGLDYGFYNNYINTIKKITPKTIKALGVKYFNKIDLKEVVVGQL